MHHRDESLQSFFVVGGAGFIGSHFVDRLLADDLVSKVTIYDNLSVGTQSHYAHHTQNPRFKSIIGNVHDTEALRLAMRGHDVVIHLASNADIAQAIQNPSIDFTEGLVLTHHVLEAMRIEGIPRLIYASGSGVYGDMGHHYHIETQGNLHPISPYGASKLAGEAFISSYCHMFGIRACVFRFANVVGPRQTHGIIYDLIHKLAMHSNILPILGNGSQSKSYIYIEDIVDAVLLAHRKLASPYEVYNVATEDHITVKEIAEIVVHSMGLTGITVLRYSEENRGWHGDIPIVRLDAQKIRALGWNCRYNTHHAIQKATDMMLEARKQHMSSFISA
jgi:UDP-glucose 4-epimerase